MSFKYLFYTVVCGSAVLYLALSDGLVNMSAASVIGSTPESRDAASNVAIGVVLALMATGSIMTFFKSKVALAGIWLVTLIAAGFSATLTVQAVSVDYAANDHSGSIQSARRSGNKDTIKQYKKEIKKLEDKMDECEADRYFAPCSGTEKRIGELTDKIAELNEDNTASKMAQKVDITDAVEEKSGIPGEVLETAAIWLRALAVPLLTSLLMMGFWLSWDKLVRSFSTAKKPQAA